MSLFKIIIQKGDMADDPKAVCKYSKFICIAEMFVDILLFGMGTESRLGGHETVSHPVRGDIRFILVVGLEFFD